MELSGRQLWRAGGRMHLASHLELLNDEKKALVKEGIEYFNELSKVKEQALPFMPNGFCNFGDKLVASGLRYDDTIYLAEWNLGEAGEKEIDLGALIESAQVSYPKKNTLQYSASGSSLKISFTEDYQARFFEL